MPAFHVRGSRLTSLLGLIAAMCFALQGYDQNVANGLLTLQTWIEAFPQINTSTTKGAQLAYNSTIQG